MAILDVFEKKETSSKKDKDSGVSKKLTKKELVKKTDKNVSVNYEGILIKPRIAEKAAILAENKVYSFIVSQRANKTEIKKAIKAIYGVDPIKVNIINIPSKKVISRGKIGVKSAKKKALVYLKKSDSIDFV